MSKHEQHRVHMRLQTDSRSSYPFALQELAKVHKCLNTVVDRQAAIKTHAKYELG